MFVERKYTNKSINEIFNIIKPKINEDEIIFSVDNVKYGIKFVTNFLTTIKKEISIENFLDKNTDIIKFIITVGRLIWTIHTT